MESIETTKRKPGEIIVTDRRLRFATSEGTTALAIENAAEKAAAVLDVRSHRINEDTVPVPLGDRVLVKRIPEVELSAQGIVIPETGKQPPSFGVVVGVGQGRYNIAGALIPLRVHVDAIVMFGKYSGTDVPLFGTANKNAEPLLSLREEEIMLVLMSKREYEAIRAAANPPIDVATK